MFIITLVLRYVFFYAVALAFLFAAAAATGYWVGGVVGGLIPTIFASLMCGVAYARRTGRRAPSEVSWGAGLLFALVNAIGGAAVFVLLAPAEVRSDVIAVTTSEPTALLLIAGLALVVTIVASRIFFGLGSRTWHGPVRA